MRIWKNLETLSKEYKRWIDREKNEPGLNPLNWVQEEIQNVSDEADCRVVAGNLEAASQHFFRHGVVQVLEAKQGWSMIRLGIRFMFTGCQIKCRSFDRYPDKEIADQWAPNIVRVSELALICCALDDFDKFDALADRLDQARSDGSVAGWNFRGSPLPRLVLGLRRYKQFGDDSDLTDLNLGVYRPVFENWHSAPDLNEALIASANYHCKQLDAIAPGEFELAPTDIFPAEIIAIKRIRKQLGLETPEIDHPLMRPPLANPPENIEEPSDKLLEEAISKVRSVAPYLVENL